MSSTSSLPDPDTEPIITAAQAAAVLKMSPRGIYAAIERGDIPSVRCGRTVRIPTRKFLTRIGLGIDQAEEIEAA